MLKKKIVLLAFILVIGALAYRFISPTKKTHSANFVSPKAVLYNSRFSYKAGVASGTAAGSVVTIDGSAGDPDANTGHLFPGDSICNANAGFDGCVGNVEYTVANIVNGTTFNTSGAIATTFETDGWVVATQSGQLDITFTTVSEVPIGGNLLITIPATTAGAGQATDGIPDTGATLAISGFDFSTIATGDISVSDVTGCTQAGWGSATVTAGNGTSTDHTIEFTRATATCATAKTVTVTIDSSPGIINPAPLTTHTQGVADSYQINIKTRDGGDGTLDESDVTISPIEGVFVSATVDETLSLTIAQIDADTGSYCGVSRTGSSPDSTATTVSWGSIAPTYLAATHNAHQLLTVSTNAKNGYSVFAEETDQMGKSGNTCTGTAPSAGDYTFSAGICIKDTLCEGACSESSDTEWTDMATYVGFGFSLEDTSGTDATFEFNDPADGGTFKARQFADVDEGGETRAAIMTNSGPVSGSAARVCYRIAISGIQPAGYYYNTVRYTAVPIF